MPQAGNPSQHFELLKAICLSRRAPQRPEKVVHDYFYTWSIPNLHEVVDHLASIGVEAETARSIEEYYSRVLNEDPDIKNQHERWRKAGSRINFE